ncbi:hypothetical protein [Streptomyces sp. NPDC050428]|uniref:hypothetical protein n=1 Tax=Streptomyces sp. NPDC050428 TaxID=3155757 RepID=UPI0034316CBF
MPAIKCGLWPPGCYLQGTFISRNTLIGQGPIGGLDGGTYTQYVEFDFNVDVFITSGDFNKAGSKLEATLECEGSWTAGVPSEARDEEACYTGLYPGREDSPSQWKFDGDTKFDLWSSAPKMPDAANGDQIATGLFTPVLKFTVPGYDQYIPTEGELTLTPRRHPPAVTATKSPPRRLPNRPNNHLTPHQNEPNKSGALRGRLKNRHALHMRRHRKQVERP